MRRINYLTTKEESGYNFIRQKFELKNLKKVVLEKNEYEDLSVSFFFDNQRESLLVYVLGAFNVEKEEGRRYLEDILKEAKFNMDNFYKVLDSGFSDLVEILK